MKIDKKIREIVLRALEDTKKEYEKFFDRYIEEMKTVETVEEFMLLKRGLLYMLLGKFPIYRDTCYFCQIFINKCESCPYAKHHGECGVPLSDWDRLRRKVRELAEFIYNTYYRGELYDEEKRES